MIQHEVDTLIIGAGVIGSSVAMHLSAMGAKGVRVVDFDLEGTRSSSELNAGGVRATLSQPINIRMSQITIDYFASVAEEVGYRDCGYLWLHPAERVQPALKARELQASMGWPVEVWDLAELRRRVPFIDKTDGIEAAFYGPRDGLVNPNLLKNHFREKARARGVIFDDRVLIRTAEREENGIRLRGERFAAPVSEEKKAEVLSSKISGAVEDETVEYRVKRVVNCAGAWAPQLAQILGYHCPSYPVRRQICLFDCRDVDLTPYGMIIDPSGVYFHPEATNGLAGFANHNEPHGVNYQYDGESFFMDVIWPALYERSTAFERLKHLTGWAGIYEVSPDECAIIGQVGGEASGAFHGSAAGRIFEAHSFSGHGVMHSYSAGQALAELMLKGRYESVDATILSGKRFETGQLLREGLVI